MKHGVAFRGLSRMSQHRMLMLRNMVTSLIEHEQIKTTLPKAREAARLAEKVITMAKKGRLADYTRASGFLLRPQLTPKLFTTLAERYRDRPGGYTRIHKFGNRPGDNAPHAILEFVDNPRDLKYEVTARAVGWEVLGKEMQERSAKTLAAEGINGITELMQKELTLDPDAQGELRTRTRWNLQKVVKYRPASALSEIGLKAEGHIDSLLAKPMAIKTLREHANKEAANASEANQTYFRSIKDIKMNVGDRTPGMRHGPLRLAKAGLGWQPGRKTRWFERRKSGVEKPLDWTQF